MRTHARSGDHTNLRTGHNGFVDGPNARRPAGGNLADMWYTPLEKRIASNLAAVVVVWLGTMARAQLSHHVAHIS